MTREEQARQMLENMKKQAAYFEEQLIMTRGGIQTLEHLLASFDDGNIDKEKNETGKS